MQLKSFGAACTVTGSMHLLTLGNRKILVDCGLFQGNDELEFRNHEAFSFDPRELDAVILTHAHLDHVGRLPLLVGRGYRGPIYCTPPTAALAETVLLDSARLQIEGYKQKFQRARRQGREDEVLPPIYEEGEVHDTLALMRPQLAFEETMTIAGCKVTPKRAGHILGSAYLVLETPDGRLLMSGDLGHRESGLQHQTTPPPEVDMVVLETTYANRTHRAWKDTQAEFAQVLRESVRLNGKILIPSFAIERSQTILYVLKTMMDSGEIPRIPIFLDSPMATRATLEYFGFSDELIDPVHQAIAAGEDPFRGSTLHTVVTSKESMQINKYDGAAIILAGNGMMTGGRIQHHLKHQLWKQNTSVVIVSYQSPHSLGGQIVEGAEKVEIMGDDVAVKAHVHTIGGFSAHADQDDMLTFLDSTAKGDHKPKVWLVHGELEVMNQFLPVLKQHGYEGNIVPDRQEIDLTSDRFRDGIPINLQSVVEV